MRAEHKTILAVDAESFSERSNFHQVAARDGIYDALRGAFGKSGLPWDDCYREDRGDGLFVLIPPEIPKNLLANPLPFELATALREYNASCPEESRIRLRVAVNAGEVHHDSHGVAGSAINHTFRLLDAEPLRKALAESPGNIALIASEWFYNEVIRHEPASAHRTYRRVRVAVKKTRAIGWICVPDHPYPPRVVRHHRKVLAGAVGLAVLCVLLVFRLPVSDNSARPKDPATPPTTTVMVQPPSTSEGGGGNPLAPQPQPDGGDPPVVPHGAPNTPRPVPPLPTPPPTSSVVPGPPAPSRPAPSQQPLVQQGKDATVQEERNVELSPVRGREAVDIDWWRQNRTSSGDLQMDQGGLSAFLNAGLAVIEDTPDATRDRCASVQNWVTRVEFSSLHVGSQLCAHSRGGRYAMIKITALPTSPASNGRLFFFGRTWE